MNNPPLQKPGSSGGGSGSSTFIGLTDVPASFTGGALKVARVNAGETALEFASVSGTGDVVGPASAVDSKLAAFDGVTGKLLKDSGAAIPTKASGAEVDTGTDDVKFVTAKAIADSALVYASEITNTKTCALTFVLNEGGSVLTTGTKGELDLYVPFACTITAATLTANESGSIVLDIWKDSYANFAPTVADTITASAKPTLSSAQKAQDATLTGWTKSIAAGDILRINVDSVTTITKCTLSLTVTKT